MILSICIDCVFPDILNYCYKCFDILQIINNSIIQFFYWLIASIISVNYLLINTYSLLNYKNIKINILNWTIVM